MTQIARGDATPLIPEETQREIVQGVPQASSVLRMFRRLPNMTRKQQRMPVLDLLPTAYFVNGDTGQKKLTKQAWKNKFINAEEVACIVPIPDAVIDDADYDIWAEIRPRIIEAIGVVVDAAMMFGVNAPALWPQAILRGAYLSNNIIVLGTLGDIAADIGEENGLMNLIEKDGFDVNGFVGSLGVKGKLRGLRSDAVAADDKRGGFLYIPNMRDGEPAMLHGSSVFYPKNGAFDDTPAGVGLTPGQVGGAHLIGGDFNQAVFSIRQDITFKVLDQATLHDVDGQTVLYNLAQQDMVALRVVIRLGWEGPNPINRVNQTEYDWVTDDGTPVVGRSPFAASVPPAAT